jgi:hypothetical protein
VARQQRICWSEGPASEPAPAAPPSGMIFRPRPRVLAGYCGGTPPVVS